MKTYTIKSHTFDTLNILTHERRITQDVLGTFRAESTKEALELYAVQCGHRSWDDMEYLCRGEEAILVDSSDDIEAVAS